MLADVSFDAPDLLEHLEAHSLDAIDDLGFGVIVMDPQGVVVWYNAHEARSTGFDPDSVIGQDFFESVGPCMNNYLVAHRYIEAGDLDEFVDYVFTLRMEPTRVRLRLLARSGSERRYLAVQFT